MDSELLIQVIRYRISHWALPENSVSQRILMQVESTYNRGNKKLKSPEYTLHDGITAAIPWSEKLNEFNVILYYLDNRVKMELGQGKYVIPTDSSFSTNEGDCNRVLLEIFPNGGQMKIAKILCNLSVHKLYAGPDEDHIAPPERRHKDIFSKPIPGFRFKRLGKAIDWNRIKTLDLQKITTTADTRSIMACLDDIAFGDAAEEDADPALLKGLQMVQFSVQYLLCSQDVMKDKRNVIHDALKTFQKEEDILDLKIAKLRARNKAMKRELAEMDRLADSYHMALKRLEPHLKNRAQRDRAITLKDKLQSILSDTSDVPEVPSDSDLSDQERRATKLKSKLIKAKPKSAVAAKERSDEGKRSEEASSKGWKSASSKGSAPVVTNGSSAAESKRSAIVEDESFEELQLQDHKSNPPLIAKAETQASDSEDDGDDGMDAWRATLPKDNPRKPAPVQNVITRDSLPSMNANRSIPKMQVTLSTDHDENKPGNITNGPEKANFLLTKDVKTTPDGGSMVMKSLSIGIPEGASSNQRQTTREHESQDETASKRVGTNTMASTSGFSTGLMSVDSLSNTAINDNRKVNSLGGPLPSNTIDMENNPTVNSRPTLNTWTPSSSASSKPLIKGKYGAQYLDDDDEEEEDESNLLGNKGIPLHKTVPVSTSTASSLKTSVAKSGNPNNEAKPFYQDQDSTLSAEDIEKHPKQSGVASSKPLDLTLSSAGYESSGQYQNDSFDTPDYKRDQYSDRDESLMYSDSKQWYSGGKAESKHGQSGSRRPSFKGGVDDSNMSISADSDPMPHLRMLESGKPSSSMMGNSSTDAFISSPDESGSHFTRLTVATNANSKNSVYNGEKGANNNHKTVANNDTGDSSSMFAAIDTSKSLVIDLDMPGFNDNHQDSSYNGGESSITMSQPNTFSTSRGTPYGFNNTNNRFRKYDDFDIDDQDEMNLGTMTMNKAAITGAAPNNKGGVGEDDDLMMNISEGSSSLNYTSTSYSAPPTRDFPSRNNFSPRPGDNDDDMVLMGTAKFNLNGRGNTGGMNGDTMEKDSLAGTMESNFNGGGTSGSMGGGIGDTILQSNESLSFQGGDSNRASGQGLRYGSTLDSNNGKNASYGSTPFDNFSNNSSAFENSRRESEYTDDNTFVSDPNNTMDSASYQNQRESIDRSRASVDSSVSANELKWKLGRAPLDLIELAQAFEVHLSGVAFTGSVKDRTVVADFEFLDVKSPKSSVVRIAMASTFQPISFSAHLIFNEETENVLRDEIAEIGDSMTFQINFYSANDERLIGQAVVELWVMIEDCCNIVRKEIDIYTVDMSSVIGTAVVDVKGYAILIKCSE